MATDYIKNAQEYYDGTATADDLGVKALDDKTLEITLIQPTSYFIDILSMWTFSPVQKATVEANGDHRSRYLYLQRPLQDRQHEHERKRHSGKERELLGC